VFIAMSSTFIFKMNPKPKKTSRTFQVPYHVGTSMKK
jgi:hypothetical protein